MDVATITATRFSLSTDLTVAGVLTAADNISMTQGKKLLLDTDGDTHISAVIDDTIIYTLGGSTVMSQTALGTTFFEDIIIPGVNKRIALNTGARIDFDSDANTSIRCSTDDTIDFEVGGSDIYQMTATNMNFGDVTFSGLDKHMQVLIKTADTSRASTTTLADDPHLITGTLLGDSARYTVDGFVGFQGGSSGDIKVAWRVPTGATFMIGLFAHKMTGDSVSREFHKMTDSTAADWAILNLSDEGFYFHGSFEMSTNAGTFALQWAQQTSNATNLTFEEHSYMNVIRQPG